MRETAESPTFLSQKFGEEELTKPSGLLSRIVGELDEVLVEERRTGNGPETHARGQDLGEAIDPENAAIDVHRKEGRDKRIRKLSEEVPV